MRWRYLTASTEVGIRPERQHGYGIREMVIYDPILPEELPSVVEGGWWRTRLPRRSARWACSALASPRPTKPGSTGSTICSNLWAGTRPPGAVPDATIGNEALYLIPGAADATVVPVVARRCGAVAVRPGGTR